MTLARAITIKYKYTQEELNQKVADMLESLGIEYAPSWRQIREYDTKLESYLRRRFKTRARFEKTFNLKNQYEYMAEVEPIEPDAVINYQLEKFMKQHGLSYMPTLAMFRKLGNTPLFHRIIYVYGSIQVAAAELGIEYIHGGEAV